MAQKSTVRTVVVSGALGAVSIVLVLFNIGFIPWFAGASITFMHVPAIIAGVLEGPAAGAVVGAIFGITSLVKAATMPQGPIDVFFTNPLISVLPRMLVGIVAWAVFRLFRGRLLAASSASAGVAGSLTNAILVLGLLVLFKAIPPAVAGTVFVSNSLIEAAAGGILSLAVVTAWKGIENRSGRARLADEDK
ncbi:MAG TPA: ECF transporter S component [Rectinemataceae bacterium]|nr:ECF transporter S component [Rectinemataceae bacterium]